MKAMNLIDVLLFLFVFISSFDGDSQQLVQLYFKMVFVFVYAINKYDIRLFENNCDLNRKFYDWLYKWLVWEI